MASSLIFTDYNSTFVVEFKTNLINSTDDNFTVCEVVGRNDAELKSGLNFERLHYTIAAFKAYATANGLKLTKLDANGSTVLSAFTGNYYGNGLGIDSL